MLQRAIAVAVAGLVVGVIVGRSTAPDDEVVTRTVTAEDQAGASRPPGLPPARPQTPPCNPAPEGARSQAYEPNDGRRRPFGPLVLDRSYGRAVMEDGDDQDWYVFCTSGQQQGLTVDVTLIEQGPQGCGLEAGLQDADGTTVGNVVHPQQLESTQTITHTAQAAGRFFVRVAGPLSPSAGCRYSLKVGSDGDLSRTLPRP